jgi:site-specific DNA recombinase
MDEAPVVAAIYLRISEDPENNELGVKRQEQDCRELAANRGWEVLEPPYTDNDKSASNGKKRPQWVALLKDIEAGNVGAVVAYSSSRMYRRPADLQKLIDLSATKNHSGIEIATVASGDIILDTADGRMVAGILASIDQGEVERSGERISAQRKQDALVIRRFRREGHAGYGYERTPNGATIVHEQGQAIRDMAQLIVDGYSPTAVCRWLEQEGTPTPTGKTTWNERTVVSILRSPRIAGLRGYKDEPPVQPPDELRWEPIIIPSDWRKLNDILDSRRDGLTYTPPKTGGYLLSGLCVCGACGGRMVHCFMRPKGHEYRIYRCQHRDQPHPDGHPSIRAEKLEEFVTRQASVMALPKGFTVINPAKVSKALRDQLDNLEKQLEKLNEDKADFELSEAEFLTQRRVLKKRLLDVNAKIAETAPKVVRRPAADGKDHIEAVVKRITILPDSVVGGIRYRSGRGLGRVGRSSLVAERTTIEWHESVTQVAEFPPEPKPPPPPVVRGFGRGLCIEDPCFKPAWARQRCHWHLKIWYMENIPGYREKQLAQKTKSSQRQRAAKDKKKKKGSP